MEFLTLNNGILCPAVGIGTFMLTPAEAENSVAQALKMGYSLVDTANAYVNERAVGRGIQQSGLAREQVFLSTKLWPSEYENENAVPENPCTACGGTGKCQECKGDGYRGSGYSVSCPRCHGALTETCIYCDANGNSTKHEGICDFPNCMGAHVYACTICGGGTKPVTCESCGGSGACNVCGGSGNL